MCRSEGVEMYQIPTSQDHFSPTYSVPFHDIDELHEKQGRPGALRTRALDGTETRHVELRHGACDGGVLSWPSSADALLLGYLAQTKSPRPHWTLLGRHGCRKIRAKRARQLPSSATMVAFVMDVSVSDANEV